MVDLAGTLFDTPIVDETYRKVAPRFRYEGDFETLGALKVLSSGPLTVGSPGGIVPPLDTLAGIVVRESTCGYDWFDRVHLIPRKKFVFGSIVAQVTDTFEIFNANRVAVSLNLFTNNVGAGVTVPDLPTPVAVMAPFTSFTGPTSVRLLYVAITVVVARNGVPSFDSSLVFTFSTGQIVTMLLSGTRVTLVANLYDGEFSERWDFPTDTIPSLSGLEQPISLVEFPIQSFAFVFSLTDEDRQRMRALLFGAQTQTLALPLWHEDVKTTATVSVSATTATVEATADVDLRVGGYAAIYESATKYDILVLSAVGANSVTFTTTPVLNSYSIGARVVPIRLGYIPNDPSILRHITKLDQIQIAFQVKDNTTGMFAGSTTGWSSYNSKVLLDDCNVIDGKSTQEKSVQKVTLIDNGTGRIELLTDWSTSRRESVKGFTARSRTEYLKLKKLLLALRGPQKSFYLPTFAEDLTAVADLVITGTTIDVANIGYTKNVISREPKATFRITFSDSTSLTRSIVSSTEVSATVERLTLNTTWPANRTVAEITRIEFLEESRFSTTSFTFRHQRVGFVQLSAPVRSLIS